MRGRIRAEVAELRSALEAKLQLNKAFEAKFLRQFLLLANRKMEAQVVLGRVAAAEAEGLRLQAVWERQKAERAELWGALRELKGALVPRLGRLEFLGRVCVQLEGEGANVDVEIECARHLNEVRRVRIAELRCDMDRVQARARELRAVVEDSGAADAVARVTLELRKEAKEAKLRVAVKTDELGSTDKSILAQKLMAQDLRFQVEWTGGRLLLAKQALDDAKDRAVESRTLAGSWRSLETQTRTQSAVPILNEIHGDSKDALRQKRDEIAAFKRDFKNDLKKSAGIHKFRFADRLAETRSRNEQVRTVLEQLRASLGTPGTITGAPASREEIERSLWAEKEAEDRLMGLNRIVAEKRGLLVALRERKAIETKTSCQKLEEEKVALERRLLRKQREIALLEDRLETISATIGEFEVTANQKVRSQEHLTASLGTLSDRKRTLQASIRHLRDLHDKLEAQTQRFQAAARQVTDPQIDQA